jgi:hypothetical protein
MTGTHPHCTGSSIGAARTDDGNISTLHWRTGGLRTVAQVASQYKRVCFSG